MACYCSPFCRYLQANRTSCQAQVLGRQCQLITDAVLPYWLQPRFASRWMSAWLAFAGAWTWTALSLRSEITGSGGVHAPRTKAAEIARKVIDFICRPTHCSFFPGLEKFSHGAGYSVKRS